MTTDKREEREREREKREERVRGEREDNASTYRGSTSKSHMFHVKCACAVFALGSGQYFLLVPGTPVEFRCCHIAVMLEKEGVRNFWSVTRGLAASSNAFACCDSSGAICCKIATSSGTAWVAASKSSPSARVTAALCLGLMQCFLRTFHLECHLVQRCVCAVHCTLDGVDDPLISPFLRCPWCCFQPPGLLLEIASRG